METAKPVRPAKRLETVNEYWFSRKLKEIARLNAEGRDIVSLGIGGTTCLRLPRL